jgi:hypothetical protein
MQRTFEIKVYDTALIDPLTKILDEYQGYKAITYTVKQDHQFTRFIVCELGGIFLMEIEGKRIEVTTQMSLGYDFARAMVFKNVTEIVATLPPDLQNEIKNKQQ